MNILFLTIGRMDSIEIHSLYPDLLRQFRAHGHKVYIVSAYEKRSGNETICLEENGAYMLHVKVGNLTKCNIIEKGISTIRLESQFKRAIKRYFSNVKFDLVLYSTPPITFANVVQYIKKRDGAKTYLLLKDIFPQNAVDLGLMKITGVRGLIYRYFRKKEKQLYALSDHIGCMSQANVNYILNHNPQIPINKVEVCPNCIEVCDETLSKQERLELRDKYGIPRNKTVFVYGGNLGKPQDVPFIISCLKKCMEVKDAYFVIAGSGTDRCLIEKYIKEDNPLHIKLLGNLPKDEYDRMVACCDIGLIFLDHRFTIPNFPSRLLSYMQAELPILACTDSNTDIGKIIVEGGFGWWCESNNAETFFEYINNIVYKSTIKKSNIKDYLFKHYTANKGYEIIMTSIYQMN